MEGKIEKIMIFGMAILVAGVLAYSVMGLISKDSPEYEPVAQQEEAAQVTGFESISSGSTGPGDVSVELTPLGVTDGRLEVGIAVNTHTVGLGGFDLSQITTLEYDGKTAKPISAPQLNGHHSSGNLVFEVDGDITDFTIRIRGIPKVDERVFAW